MEFSLKEFVELCNKCSSDINEPTEGKDNAAKRLGVSLLCKNRFKDEYDKIFFESLIKTDADSKEYTFLQDNSVKAIINPFEPFSNMDEKVFSKLILRQKWHVLIAVLAYFDIFCDKGLKYDIGKITKIILDEDKRNFTIVGSRKSKTYGPTKSVYMNKWIFDYLLKDCRNHA